MSEYVHAVNAIITFAGRYRHMGLAGIDVTRALAGPMEPGGLLIILEAPRPSHPWARGVDAVISDCRSLEILQEAINIASLDQLSLAANVSVLDRWPFFDYLSRGILEGTETDTLIELDELAKAAIIAKRPDVILCMGDAAQQFVTSWATSIITTTGGQALLLNGRHPSYIANRNGAHDETERSLFLATIKRACRIASSFVEQEGSNLSRYLDVRGQTLESANSKIIPGLVDFLLPLCIHCKGGTTQHCVKKPVDPQSTSYLRITRNQKRCIKIIVSSQCHHKQAKRVLLGVLVQLNRVIRKTSYFLPTYETDEEAAASIVRGKMEEFEASILTVCGLEPQVHDGGGNDDHDALALALGSLRIVNDQELPESTFRRLDSLLGRVRDRGLSCMPEGFALRKPGPIAEEGIEAAIRAICAI